MKPTSQISDSQNASRSFPFSDYNFQPTIEAKSVSAAAPRTTKAPAFHELSREIFAVKTTGDYIAELLMFVVIAGIVAWPVIAALHALTRMVRNY